VSAPFSPAQRFADRLVQRHGPKALDALDRWLVKRDDVELAALRYDWAGFWARPNQIPPEGAWQSWGFLGARGLGKTRAIAEFLHLEVLAGRANRIALIGQNEESGFKFLVDGPAGLIETSPPWFKARWEKEAVWWPNGARAFLYTPEKPGNLRGPEHDHAWASELIAWPHSKRAEAWANLMFGLRIGVARLLWDTSPKRRHPMLRSLVARANERPDVHVIVRGATRDNEDNLTAAQLDELERQYGGTRTGDEELGGIFFDDEEGALWDSHWIEDRRANLPARLVRRVLVIDPAISERKGTDDTGLVELGQSEAGHVFVLGDHSGRHKWETWGELAIERYVEGKCDLILIETNRGGRGVVANLRAAAKERGLTVVEIDKAKARPARNPNAVYVLEVHAKVSKQERAEPVAGEYQRGHVSHVLGADLADLEEELTTWIPGEGESPNRLDALVWGVWELRQLEPRPDGKRAMRGIEEANEKLVAPRAQPAVGRGYPVSPFIVSPHRGRGL
jgi:phage terminase large subunit-like protein